ncbi:c-type cytochrome [Paucibacter soli]|uniref:c-type cytochrome n=1 Tax=Paucibacter soli TaxID=3133433 RepID=UPI0030B734F9
MGARLLHAARRSALVTSIERVKMNSKSLSPRWALCALVAAAFAVPQPAHAVDADAAKALARQNNCLKCHGTEKAKDGPSFKETAAKYRGKPDAVDQLTKHLTTAQKAKFPDGHEEEHKVVKAKDAADVKNLAEWVLSH